MSSILDAALAYAARGWPIFPARADKTPYPKNGVLDATTSERQIREWWKRWPEANVALDVGGAGMMVLDLDPGHNIEELEKNVGSLPETHLRAHTPRGGTHLFYALADGENVPASASKLAPHVDVRSFHSYVLLSPSYTRDGAYTWEATDRPAYRSDRMVEMAQAARGKHADRDRWLIEPDLPENVEAAERWLREDAKIAVEGQGGDACAYSTAAMLKSYGISGELALDLMWEHWNPKCDPPWSADEADHLRAKVEHAYEYNTSPPGNMTAAYRVAKKAELFRPVTADLPSGDETKVAGFRFADREALRHVTPPAWIVEDFVPEESYVILFGAYSTFKTFLALDIALTVALDHEPIDALWMAPDHGPVLFAAGEGRSSMSKRVTAWEQVHCRWGKVDNLVLVDPVPMIDVNEEALEAFVSEALRRHPNGYRLTVIDTAGKALMGADENSQQAASALTALVQRLRYDLGGSVLVLHHSGHGDESRPRGSSVFGADADTLVRVDRDDKAHVVSLTMTKQKDAPEWDRPRHARLDLVRLPEDGGDSLVAVPPAPGEVPGKKVDNEGNTTGGDALTLAAVDRALGEILSTNPTRPWTQTDLVAALAHHESISVPEKKLTLLLKELRGPMKDTAAHRCYHPERSQKAGRWMWREPD